MAAAVAVPHKSGLRRAAFWTILTTSIAWSVLRWDSTLDAIKSKLTGFNLTVFASVVVLSETLFIGGAVILAYGVGRRVFVGSGINPLSWTKRVLHLRKSWRQSIGRESGNRLALLGLNLNWLGALGTTGVLPIVTIALVLPVSSWGLMAPFVVDVVATCSIRRPLQAKLKAGRQG
jgi:hypothetical protein